MTCWWGHLRIVAVEKQDSHSETVNVARLCGIKEFLYEFKTSLRCRDPNVDFTYLHVIPAGKKKKSIFGDEPGDELPQTTEVSGMHPGGDSLWAQKFADFAKDAQRKNFI